MSVNLSVLPSDVLYLLERIPMPATPADLAYDATQIFVRFLRVCVVICRAVSSSVLTFLVVVTAQVVLITSGMKKMGSILIQMKTSSFC